MPAPQTPWSQALVSVSPPRDHFGEYGTVSVSYRPVVGVAGKQRLLWAATGEAVFVTGRAISEQSDAATFWLPHVDQNGFRDTSGAVIKNWHYVVTVTARFGDTVVESYTQTVQPLVGQGTELAPIDLDLVPSGGPVAPVLTPQATVTSVGGRTGPVTVDHLEDMLEGRLGGGGGPGASGPEADVNVEGVIKGIFLNSIEDIPPGLPSNRLVVLRGEPPAPQGVAPQVAGVATAYTPFDSGSSVVVPLPAGVVAGDVLIMAARHQSTFGTAPGWTVPSGWTQISPNFVAAAAARIMAIFAMRVTPAMVTAGLPASVTMNTAGSSANGRRVAMMFRVAGVDPTTLVSGVAPNYGGTEIAGGVRSTAYPLAGPALQLTFFANENTASNASTPATVTAGHSLVGTAVTALDTSQTRTSLHAYAKPYTEGGEAEQVTATWSAANGPGVQSVALCGVVA